MIKKIIFSSVLFTAISAPSFASSINTQLEQATQSVSEKVITWRRHLHQYPELSNREFETAKYITNHLKSLGLEVQTDVAHTGVVAKLSGGKKAL